MRIDTRSPGTSTPSFTPYRVGGSDGNQRAHSSLRPAKSAGLVRTRTYLIPEASLPTRFGLSETYGRFRTPAAAGRFLTDVRRSVARCEDRDLATQVSGERRETVKSPQLDLSSWDLQTEISDKQKVRFRLGFVRVGNTVAQLTFAPAPSDDMTATGFHSLLVRSGDRLRELG